MEKIKEKPTLGERVKEKAVSAPKELLRKGLDDGSERLRTQLRDTAQQGRRAARCAPSLPLPRAYLRQ